ncbi:hypothetical protein L227DRAFT_617863, partial [Lentinus tigrinus ALCF2SS1-6]
MVYLRLYYLGDDKNQFTLSDYHRLVQEKARNPIDNYADYLHFYSRFRPVVDFLTSLNPSRLSEDLASTQLMGLVPKELLPAIFGRLDVTAPNKTENDIYTVAQVHEAIRHVWLERTRRGAYMSIIAPGDTSAASAVVPAFGAGGLARASSPSNALAPQPPPRSPSPSIKEEIGEALAGFKAEILSTLMQSLRTAEPTPQNRSGAYNQPSPPVYGPTLNQPQFNQSQNPSPFPQQYPPASSAYPSRPDHCFYCFRTGCHSWTCPYAEEDIQAGYIQRHSATRRILMPGGGEPPSGPSPMRERVMRWHADHPGQRAAAQIHGSSAQPPPSSTNQQPAPPAATGSGQVHSMLLSVDANLQDIENELTEEEAAHAMQLAADLVKGRRRREVFDGVHLPPPPRRRTRAHPATPAPMGDSEASPPSSTTTELPTSEVADRGSDVDEDTPEAPTLDAPAHPFAAVPDGSGAGAPKVRDYAYHGTAVSKGTQTAPLQAKVSAAKDPALSLPAKKEPAYKHVLGAYDPGALDRVFQRNFDTTAN